MQTLELDAGIAAALPLPKDPASPLIILVGSGYHLYREYLLKLVSQAGRVWLFTPRDPTWESKYIVGTTVVDTLDAPAMIEAATGLRRQTDINGVLCWDEVRMSQSALLAEALKLPGGDPEAIGRCRDKHNTRIALDAMGVPQATSRLVASLAEAWLAAEEVGYPAVLKPRALGASIGVSKVNSPEELEAGFMIARAAFEDGVPYFERGVLVESFLDGPEISVDSACVNGVVSPLFIARKTTGFDPYFEEIGHIVDANDPLLSDPKLLQVLADAHRALGFRNGITHSELRLCADGPRIIEVNCRLGGDMIPRVGMLACGIDPGKVAVDICCGRPVDVRSARARVAAIRFYYPSEPEIYVANLDIDQSALPAAIVVAESLAAPGQKLVLPPVEHVSGRMAFAIAVDDTAAACEAALDAAAAAIHLHTAEQGPQ